MATSTTKHLSTPATVLDSPFGPEETNRLRLALLRVVRSIRTNSVGTVTPSQMAVLSTLRRRGPCTVGQIAEYEHVQPPSTSKIVATLESRGLVQRMAHPEDRRCTPIALSRAGEQLLDEVGAAGVSWLAERLAQLSDEDRTALSLAVEALEHLLPGDE